MLSSYQSLAPHEISFSVSEYVADEVLPAQLVYCLVFVSRLQMHFAPLLLSQVATI